MTSTKIEMGCPVCGAAPGTDHSLACCDQQEFARQEAARQMLEDDAGIARTDLATARIAVGNAMDNVRRIAPRLIAAGYSEVKAAEMLGIERMTLRKALGK